MSDEIFDLDAWLEGATRAERSVTLYAKNHLLAPIDELEKRWKTALREESNDSGQRAMGDTLESRQLEAELEKLYVELDKSKLVLHIQALTAEEVQEVRDKVAEDLQDQADDAAKRAREGARIQIKRMDVKDPADINLFVRGAAKLAADQVIEKEASIRLIAKAIVRPAMNPDQVRVLAAKVGEAQIGLINQAYSRAQNEAPVVTVPKSSTPSATPETGTSS